MRKNWQGEDELLLKNSTVHLMATLTNCAIPGSDLHCVGPLVLWGLLQHLPAKYR